MNILNTIIAAKRIEVEERKKTTPLNALEKKAFFQRTPLSLASFLKNPDKTGIIAEFKRKSPSKGNINSNADVTQVTGAYARFGASAISVLTDEQFFGGSAQDLEAARQLDIPLLRKDFMIDSYQVYEAKAMGADIILLIAACLKPTEVYELSKLAKELGLSVLLELHDEEELKHVGEFTPIVGINNRNLKTFEVNIEKSLEMASKLPPNCLKVAESGIDKVEMIQLFKKNGFDGFLIGEQFMKASNPAKSFEQFINELNNNA
ncbi:indole-3-glycerol phosphate synthase TrpC [Flavihumibacter sp. UBA7668]|uniref:indole-3-glycerol phosphate synthase TrpC n=1 Tax=Flavihumibacter sp. UBA7668 TaxID=1946542 RepID=UPI0025C4C73A|nr:indole-3-glycerol phosphate synthase TrpC [Flavihumibacter sp. UBA7668]